MSLHASSTDRPLRLRVRPDLNFTPILFAGQPTWVVEDPLTLEHFQFTEQEYTLIEKLRHHVSMATLKKEFEQRFAPNRISLQSLSNFISRLYNLGLLVSDSPGQGAQLQEQADEKRRLARITAWTQLLAIRLPGINPDHSLHRALPYITSLFHPISLLLAMLILTIGLATLIGNFQYLYQSLPDLVTLCDIRFLPYLLLTLGCVKVVHELAHAFTCKYFGGTVHDMGILLLAFTPCLYCDVTSAWKLPNKWHRIAISAAGIIVELVIASIAIVVWSLSHPDSLLHLLAQQLVIVCSISTLLVNANPLLRYDGYYILSDLLESPNLWQRSREATSDIAARVVLGLASSLDSIVPHRHRSWLVAYAVSSHLYLLTIILGLLWFAYQLALPLHLETVVIGLGTLVLTSQLLVPFQKLRQLARDPLRKRQVRYGRASLFLLGTIAFLVTACLTPLPAHVQTSATVMPSQAQRVYATVQGRLEKGMENGSSVRTGDVIAQLSNEQIDRQREELAGAVRSEELRLSHLLATRTVDDDANKEIPATQTALASLRSQQQDHQREADRLTVRAPVAGRLLHLGTKNVPDQHPGELPLATGAMLAPQNIGTTVSPGTLLGWIVRDDEAELISWISESEVDRLAVGQEVDIRFAQYPLETFPGILLEIATDESSGKQSDLLADEPIQYFAIAPAAGVISETFRIRIGLQTLPEHLVWGSRGEVRITTAPRSTAERLLRFLRQKFRTSM